MDTTEQQESSQSSTVSTAIKYMYSLIESLLLLYSFIASIV